MPYLKIPPSFLPKAISKIVVVLEREITNRINTEAGKLIDKIRSEGCPADLTRAVQKVQGLSNGVNKLESRLTKIKKLPEVILLPIQALEATLAVLLSIPAPQSPTPIPGLPIAITNKLTELIIVALEFIAQKKEDAETIVSLVDGPAVRLQFINFQLGRVTSLTGICRVERAIKKKLDEGELSFEELVARGLINDEGNFVTSDLAKQFVGGAEGRSISDLSKQLGISNEEVEKRLKDANQVSDLDTDPTSQLDDLLNRLDGLDLDVITDIRKELDSLSTSPVDTNLDGRFFHRGPDGTLYRLEIKTDEKSPKVAAKRFAVALDEEEVVVLEGPKSFASDTDILLNEIKFRIDNQLS